MMHIRSYFNATLQLINILLLLLLLLLLTRKRNANAAYIRPTIYSGLGVGDGGPSRKVSVEVSAAKALNPDYV